MFSSGEEIIFAYLLHVTLVKEREEKAHKHWILALFLNKIADPAKLDKVIYSLIWFQSPVESKEVCQH